MDNWSVYKHTLPDGKVYIGITSKSPSERWEDGFGYKEQHHFFKHIVKFGWDNIEHKIVTEGVSEKTARLIEKELIKEAGTSSVNVQHYEASKIEWQHLPMIDDEVYDRKAKFRRMNDCWLEKAKFKNTIPFDWDIQDESILFSYAIDEEEQLSFWTIGVPIPYGISYVGLYDHLTRRLDIRTLEPKLWYNKLKEVG